MRIYKGQWFKTEEEAKAFQKEHGGALYKNVPRSRTKRDHEIASVMFGFDKDEYPYSVNWADNM